MKNFAFNAGSPFVIMGNFLKLGLISILIGLGGGVFASLLFKYIRILTHSAITETLLLLIVAMICYFLSGYSGNSDIISLLTCGITMAQYTWYNLSPQGKTVSSVTFSVLGSAAESFVFSYLGLCVFTYAG